MRRDFISWIFWVIGFGEKLTGVLDRLANGSHQADSHDTPTNHLLDPENGILKRYFFAFLQQFSGLCEHESRKSYILAVFGNVQRKPLVQFVNGNAGIDSDSAVHKRNDRI